MSLLYCRHVLNTNKQELYISVRRVGASNHVAAVRGGSYQRDPNPDAFAIDVPISKRRRNFCLQLSSGRPLRTGPFLRRVKFMDLVCIPDHRFSLLRLAILQLSVRAIVSVLSKKLGSRNILTVRDSGAYSGPHSARVYLMCSSSKSEEAQVSLQEHPWLFRFFLPQWATSSLR